MLTLMLPALDNQESVEVHLEHSLVSLSKWEMFYKKPFFNKDPHTPEEFSFYVSQMVTDATVPENFESRLTNNHIATVQKYINTPNTATTFRDDANQPPSKEVITNEVIYYWLVTFNIPFDPVETWHLSRLMTLVRICGIKQSKPTKMTKQQQAAEYRRLNEQRRRELGTSG